jgi:hypothetical protein
VKALEQQNLKKDNTLQKSSLTKGLMKERILRNEVGKKNMVSMKVEQEGFVTKKMVPMAWSPKKVWGGISKKNVNEMESLNEGKKKVDR